MKSAIIIGASGAIGNAFHQALKTRHPNISLTIFSRTKPRHITSSPWHHINITDETSIKSAADTINQPVDLIILTTGVLHTETIKPEKSLRDISFDTFQNIFNVNTIGPALIAKYFLPKLAKGHKSVFAAISARVGSISDNRLGGWYAYRASKAALNMILKTASIETARRNKHAVITGLHPGTVDSNLSKPFQNNVPDTSLFTPEYSANKMLDVIEGLNAADTGYVYDFNGLRIPF
jgi:NAD(P)-dependent dehydrogenase (short-subunit alcohol dehydrogenase family)